MILALTPGSAGSPASLSHAILSDNRPSARFSFMRFSFQRRCISLAETIGMDTNLIPINKVSRGRVHDAIREALRSGVDVDALEDFLASVDWSGTDRQRPKIADDLGQLEGLNWRYSNSELTKSQYVAYLLNFLPAGERRKCLLLDGGAVTIRFVNPARRRAEHPAPPQLDQSADQPQTGSGARPGLAAGVCRNDMLPVA